MTGTHRERIVIVEDDEALAKLLTRLLEFSGCDVHAVASGTAALHYIAEHEPHLVILDLMLPDVDGYEVCRQLRQQFTSWSLPILMLTGKDKPADQLRGYAFGADAYLTKPCEPTELLQTVALLLGRPTVQ